jgi:hypothetical protein
MPNPALVVKHRFLLVDPAVRSTPSGTSRRVSGVAQQDRDQDQDQDQDDDDQALADQDQDQDQDQDAGDFGGDDTDNA